MCLLRDRPRSWLGSSWPSVSASVTWVTPTSTADYGYLLLWITLSQAHETVSFALFPLRYLPYSYSIFSVDVVLVRFRLFLILVESADLVAISLTYFIYWFKSAPVFLIIYGSITPQTHIGTWGYGRSRQLSILEAPVVEVCWLLLYFQIYTHWLWGFDSRSLSSPLPLPSPCRL